MNSKPRVGRTQVQPFTVCGKSYLILTTETKLVYLSKITYPTYVTQLTWRDSHGNNEFYHLNVLIFEYNDSFS